MSHLQEDWASQRLKPLKNFSEKKKIHLTSHSDSIPRRLAESVDDAAISECLAMLFLRVTFLSSLPALHLQSSI